jgi:N utilization substance protein B
MSMSKRRARAVALQALYEVLVQEEPLDEALESAVKVHEAAPADEAEARRLIGEVQAHWPLERLEAAIDDGGDDEVRRLARAFLRHVGRIVALQVLYEVDSVAHRPREVLQHLSEDGRIPPAAIEFARSLVTGVLTHKTEIDAVLGRAAPAWPVEQIAVVDRNILRLAIYEILLDNKTPVRAAINEAVELAKTFGSDNSAKFVNGVLGSVSLSAAGHA